MCRPKRLGWGLAWGGGGMGHLILVGDTGPEESPSNPLSMPERLFPFAWRQSGVQSSANLLQDKHCRPLPTRWRPLKPT